MTISQDDVKKALSALKDVAKGHAAGSTVSTAVDTMNGATPATQVFHTPSNSDPGSHAGSVAETVPGNGTGNDMISPNGTDHVASAMAKAIMDKLAKGQPLENYEVSFVQGGGLAKGGFPFKKDDDKDEDDEVKKSDDKDEDDKDDMNKSINDLAREDNDLAKGFEVSDFLCSLVGVIAKSQELQEQRIVGRLSKGLTATREENQVFQVELSKALGRLSELLTAQDQRINQVEATPARGPLSIPQASVVQKSFGDGAPGAPTLSKAQINDALFELHKSKKVSAGDIYLFDANGTISDHNMSLVKSLFVGKQ